MKDNIYTFKLSNHYTNAKIQNHKIYIVQSEKT